MKALGYSFAPFAGLQVLRCVPENITCPVFTSTAWFGVSQSFRDVCGGTTPRRCTGAQRPRALEYRLESVVAIGAELTSHRILAKVAVHRRISHLSCSFVPLPISSSSLNTKTQGAEIWSWSWYFVHLDRLQWRGDV